MVAIPFLQAAGSATVLVLAVSSGRNILQTHKAVSSYDGSECGLLPSLRQSTASETATRLRDMSRRELLDVFLSSEPPRDMTEIYGDWNAYQPDNNGPIMTTVNSFMTNQLFGRNRTWNGKVFRAHGQGVNRFYPRGNIAGNVCEEEHKFEYQLAPSKLQPSTTSVTVDYSSNQSPISLWRTMSDEVRLIKCRDGNVLIGFGALGWSGGMSNASPFVLYR